MNEHCSTTPLMHFHASGGAVGAFLQFYISILSIYEIKFQRKKINEEPWDKKGSLYNLEGEFGTG